MIPPLFAHNGGMEEKSRETKYAHNPNFCMIRPEEEDESVVSTGSS